MQNLYSLTDFVRLMKSKGMGFSSLYLVPRGKSYGGTSRSLVATACREGVVISTAKAIVLDPSSLKALEAIRVTVK